jgi:hypothetical protein
VAFRDPNGIRPSSRDLTHSRGPRVVSCLRGLCLWADFVPRVRDVHLENWIIISE